MPISRGSRVHFIGIGGIGMSGIARVLLARGYRVSGSDVQMTPTMTQLRQLGAQVAVGHAADRARGADLVVYSSSIVPRNPELAAARDAGTPIRSRGQMLAMVMAGRTGIAVSGAHGKTTTTSLIASTLLAAGQDPTIIVGGEVAQFGGNARLGRGPHVVVEADESDGSFVYLTPAVAVITNIEEEHLDYYRNLHEILQAYRQFVERLPARGLLVCCGDDPGVRRLLPATRRRRCTYGLDAACDVTAQAPQVAGGRIEYVARYQGRRLGRVSLQIPGLHNLVNSLAAIGVGLALGLEFRAIRRALAGYAGAGRRFQRRGEVDGVMIVEDYAHHPTEIAATLQAARTWSRRRIFCVFQPHRFSRTKYLQARFGTAFAAADRVILTDVYAASEDPIAGVGVELLSRAVRASGFSAVQVLRRAAIVPHLAAAVRPGDLVLVLGAGDIGQVAGELVHALTARPAVSRRAA
ncbi:MAG: UDP-N-acetylmuramate--L-alanine ligase [Candidatus Omnitrophica bacterium]|nr:UDP-N-acetylmuramate--L-alanine ligase [Candidatus Omnitrophota bacterium]